MTATENATRNNSLGLTMTCKEVREECLQLYYSINTFQLESAPLENGGDLLRSLNAFRYSIGHENAMALRTINVHTAFNAGQELYHEQHDEQRTMRVMSLVTQLRSIAKQDQVRVYKLRISYCVFEADANYDEVDEHAFEKDTLLRMILEVNLQHLNEAYSVSMSRPAESADEEPRWHYMLYEGLRIIMELCEYGMADKVMQRMQVAGGAGNTQGILEIAKELAELKPYVGWGEDLA